MFRMQATLGLEVLEAAVVLAGLGDEDVAVAAAGGAVQLQDIGPDDEIGVDADLLEAVDQPAGGGALAVRAADGDPFEVVHQLAEELGVLEDPTAPPAGHLQLGVALLDRRRDHDHVRGRVQILGAVADVNPGPQVVQTRAMTAPPFWSEPVTIAFFPSRIRAKPLMPTPPAPMK